MKLATVLTRAQIGIAAPPVVVETHISNGISKTTIVGLPETAVRESKDRVRSALLNSHFSYPAPGRITVNLAPADLPKEGGRFDLAIALGILASSGQIDRDVLGAFEFIGELALNGDLRPITGALPAALACHAAGRALFVPVENAAEAARIPGACVLPASNLLQICAHLNGNELIAASPPRENPIVPDMADLRDVRGQTAAKRALAVAASGGLNLLMCGPPGTGKTMLATRLPGILPPMPTAEWLEVAAIRSIAGFDELGVHRELRPFRAPHHSASGISIVGGGGNPKPGEITLAHHGVLFLDELPEWPRRLLELLREPLESGEIAIARASRRVVFPARFQLVAAMNPWRRVAFLPHSRIQLNSLIPKPYDFEPTAFGEHLKKKRLVLGLTQEQLATQLELNPFSIHNWENGYTKPDIRFIPKLIAFLGYDPEPPNPQTIADHLKAKRRELGWSQRKLAAHLHLDPSTVSAWECGAVIHFCSHHRVVASFLGLPEKQVHDTMKIQWKHVHGRITQERA